MFVFDKNHKDLFIYEERWIWCFLQVLKLNRRKLKKTTTKNKKAEGELESDYISFASSGEEYDTDTFSYHEHFLGKWPSLKREREANQSTWERK